MIPPKYTSLTINISIPKNTVSPKNTFFLSAEQTIDQAKITKKCTFGRKDIVESRIREVKKLNEIFERTLQNPLDTFTTVLNNTTVRVYLANACGEKTRTGNNKKIIRYYKILKTVKEYLLSIQTELKLFSEETNYESPYIKELPDNFTSDIKDLITRANTLSQKTGVELQKVDKVLKKTREILDLQNLQNDLRTQLFEPYKKSILVFNAAKKDFNIISHCGGKKFNFDNEKITHYCKILKAEKENLLNIKYQFQLFSEKAQHFKENELVIPTAEEASSRFIDDINKLILSGRWLILRIEKSLKMLDIEWKKISEFESQKQVQHELTCNISPIISQLLGSSIILREDYFTYNKTDLTVKQ